MQHPKSVELFTKFLKDALSANKSAAGEWDNPYETSENKICHPLVKGLKELQLV